MEQETKVIIQVENVEPEKVLPEDQQEHVCRVELSLSKEFLMKQF